MSQPEQRHVLRPEHFSVAPSLLGLPLARPARRLVALLIDLLLVALLVRMAGAWLLGLAAAWAFLRFATRSGAQREAQGRTDGRKRVWIMRAAGALILFLVVKDTWSRARSAGMQLAGLATGAPAASSGDAPRTPPSGGVTALRAIGGAVTLMQAEDAEDATEAARNIAGAMHDGGSSDEEIRAALEGAAKESGKPWMLQAVRSAMPQAAAPVPPESLAVWHAAALLRHDTAAVDSLAPRLGAVLARDSLDQLRGEVSDLRSSRDELSKRADRAEHRGLLASIFQLLDELGIGFGWTGLYFTALTSLWKGQTPGKRLMGIRVLRLNGEPMTLWVSFERFGGYAAGLVTGLLGFAQVLWDRNRQAIHDKITETVVVRDAPVPPAPIAPEAERRRPAFVAQR